MPSPEVDIYSACPKYIVAGPSLILPEPYCGQVQDCTSNSTFKKRCQEEENKFLKSETFDGNPQEKKKSALPWMLPYFPLAI